MNVGLLPLSVRNSVLAIAVLSAACGSEDSQVLSDASVLSDAGPPVEGTWYQPDVNATWQWQLVGPVNPSYAVDVYDIDLFNVPTSEIASLQAMGKKVICYFSAGSYEPFRTDSGDFPDAVKGKVLDGFEDEKWLDVRSSILLEIMAKRLDLAVEKGCDGVEPDNMDGYQNDSGFPLLAGDQLAFNQEIANLAHARGLAVGLKNDLDQIPELLPYYDFSVNEQCHEYDECEALLPFISAGKPVWNAEYKQEYVSDSSEICSDAQMLGLRTLVMPLDLDDEFRISCD